MKKYLLFSAFIALVFIFSGCSTSKTPSTDTPKNTPSEQTKENEVSKVKPGEIVELKNGDSYDMNIEYVEKEINGENFKMMAYNGSIPGPTLKVKQGSEITVNLKNNTDIPTSLHSHGIRLQDKFDGVVDSHRPALKPGETFSYKLKFPDVGMFWYHPHLHEPFTQSHGLYGNYWVMPDDSTGQNSYWSAVNREIPLMFNDISIQNGKTEVFDPKVTRFALMGRFGNVMLVNGETNYHKDFQAGEVVRFYFTNASNTRTHNLSIPNVKMKLVGGDNGKYERETWKENIILSPSERAIVEVFFEKPGSYKLQSVNPQTSYDLATFNVKDEKVNENYAKEFQELRENKDVIADIDQFRDAFDKKPDKSIQLTLDMQGMGGNMNNADDHGSHMMPDGHMMMNSDMMMSEDLQNTASNKINNDFDGIEWEDTMTMMNAMSTTNSLKWKIVDEETKKENMDINWNFKVGDKVKIKIFNDPKSMHPMQHPIHLHGQRFLVLTRNGVKNENLVWKDTTLIPKGDTVELLVDMANPGKWMGHCHISEHLESGMMFSFEVR